LGKDLTPRAHQPLILYSVLSNEFLLHSEADILFHPSTPDDQRVIWQNRLDNLHKRKYHQKLLIGLSSKWKSERSGIGLGMDIFIQRVLTDVNDGIVKRPGGLGIRIAIEYAFGGIHALN
jgi:hypothetical protein